MIPAMELPAGPRLHCFNKPPAMLPPTAPDRSWMIRLTIAALMARPPTLPRSAHSCSARSSPPPPVPRRACLARGVGQVPPPRRRPAAAPAFESARSGWRDVAACDATHARPAPTVPGWRRAANGTKVLRDALGRAAEAPTVVVHRAEQDLSGLGGPVDVGDLGPPGRGARHVLVGEEVVAQP